MMRQASRNLVGAIPAIAAIFAMAAVASGETWTLQLKRLEPKGAGNARGDYVYRTVAPQGFFEQLNWQGKERGMLPGNPVQTAAFARIVKKEPKYQSAFPFRGVAKLGSQEYAFALDAVSPTPAAPKAEAARKKPAADSAVGKLADRLLKAIAPAAAPAIDGITYNRLYFDFNHNGDLTDDKVVAAEVERMPLALMGAGQSYARFEFPQVEATIDVEGVKLDYAFSLQGQAMVSPQFSYVAVSLNAAAYREGDITLAGKKHHVVLVDFNSNGRFDDQIAIHNDIHSPDGRIYSEQGDMLLIDVDPANPGHDMPYEVTASDRRYHVSKVIAIDGRFYDLKISPAGDKLTLTAAALPMGAVTSPSDGLRAVLYGELGFVKIQGERGKPIPLPAGRWNLLSYTIDRTGVAPSGPAAKQAEGSWLGSVAEAVGDLLGGRILPGVRDRYSVVTAEATTRCKAITVGKGETVALPLGPPYKPLVTASPIFDNQGTRQTGLQLSLVGSAGEVCTNMMVDGDRPPKPKFTITDDKGKRIDSGSFEYG
jgi:hypothetical protein